MSTEQQFEHAPFSDIELKIRIIVTKQEYLPFTAYFEWSVLNCVAN